MNMTEEDGYTLLDNIDNVWRKIDQLTPRNKIIEDCANRLIAIAMSFTLNNVDVNTFAVQCDLHNISFMHDVQFTNQITHLAFSILMEKTKFLPETAIKEYLICLAQMKSFFETVVNNNYKGSV